jgi:hypothetical protein
MGYTRDLCLNCVKADLRYLILDRTTVAREGALKLYFERLKLAQDQKDAESFMFNSAKDQIADLDLA